MSEQNRVLSEGESPELSGWRRLLAEAGSRVEHTLDDLKYALKRRSGYTEPINVQLYRGYGTAKRARVAGRVLEAEQITAPSPDDSSWANFVRMFKTFESDEVPGARVRIELAGHSIEVTTDSEGFFEHAFEGGPFVTGQLGVTCELLEPVGQSKGQPQGTTFRGEVFIPRPEAQFVVISDVDDTVMHTDATSLLRSAIHTLLTNSYGRVPFPGVAAFYRALHRGTLDERRAAEGLNPFFYLTSSMWNVYDVMRLFFEVNRVPAGPILMRDLGLTSTQLLKGTHEEHKVARVRELMELYPEKRFLLIGDTGQRDAEIYLAIVEELAASGDAERVVAVYLRDVSSGARDKAVRAIVEQIRAHNVACLAAESSAHHARHAAQAGLIDPDSLGEIEGESEQDQAAEREGKPSQVVKHTMNPAL